jgi:hypothetical protein
MKRLIILAAFVPLLGAACGTSPSSTGSGGATRSQSTSSQLLAFSHCVQHHGAPSFPDPDSSGALDKSDITPQHLGVSDATLVAAENACQHLLPNGGGGRTQAQLQKEWTDARRFSVCMHRHGVPNWPDPTPYPPHPEDPTFKLHAAGIGFHQGTNANIVNSPQIEAKVERCESLEHVHMSGWFD